ncbi:MAG: putative MFS-type transporter [Candidatus Fermentimicrarchaeum limneticum]|uniref:Putative MFS-type transporter n=1 Tax=Fermentimicrarchaeum limneticum TaxID=2795018 RepID=A0A7D6BFM3_FERL1|nr:MAG: putative MFS-type transporter [Candidatus Fermentimicrarchaeum limneticum]
MAGRKLFGVGRNIIALGAVSFFTDISSEMIFPILPIFLTSILGASKEAVGLIEGVADSMSSIFDILVGYFSDKFRRRKDFVVAGYGFSSIVKIGIALSTAWWHVLIMRGLERVGKGLRTAPRDSIIAASVNKETRGRAFGLHRSMDTLGAVVGPVFAYIVLRIFGESEAGYRYVFYASLLPAFIAVAVIILFVREPRKKTGIQKKHPFWESLRKTSGEYKKFLLVSVLFSLAYFSFAFFIVRAADIGVKPEDVILLYILYNIIYMLSSVPAGSLSDRIGRKPVIGGAFLLYGVVCLGFAFASSWWHAALLFALYGIFVAADESVNKAYISDLEPDEIRGMALGAYNTAVAAAYLPASILVGVLWTAMGPVVGFGVAAVIAIVSAFALMIYGR